MKNKGSSIEMRDPSKRVIWLSATGIAVCFFLALLVAIRAIPILRTHGIVREVGSAASYHQAVKRLGGEEKASERIAAYLRAPSWMASEKVDALFVLARCGKTAVPILIEALRDGDPDVRLNSIAVLNHLGAADQKVILALVNGLHDDDILVRGRAADALTRIGGPTIPFLRKALSNENNPVLRELILKIISELGENPKGAPGADPPTTKILEDIEE